MTLVQCLILNVCVQVPLFTVAYFVIAYLERPCASLFNREKRK